jgi:hypothetical protein
MKFPHAPVSHRIEVAAFCILNTTLFLTAELFIELLVILLRSTVRVLCLLDSHMLLLLTAQLAEFA